MTTDWRHIARSLVSMCPSDFYRSHAASLLARVERLGPLGPAEEEFRRVCRFLHYNDPTYLGRVVQELLERASGPRPRLRIQHNAWRYVVATHDEWIAEARIFYLAAGLLEGTLRSRLNQRMTDYFGPRWPAQDALVPSFTRDSLTVMSRAARFDRIARAAKTVNDFDLAVRVSEQVQMLPEPPPPGDAFVASLGLAALQAFFTSKSLYNGKPQLKELLIDQRTGKPAPREQVTSVFDRYRKARNAVAHYDLGSNLSFAQALYTAALIAEWLGADLQHFYSAVDTRRSTELSRLLGPQADDLGRGVPLDCCDAHGCDVGGPWDWVITSATPTDGAALVGTTTRRACLYHRVQFQAARHRHERLG